MVVYSVKHNVLSDCLGEVSVRIAYSLSAHVKERQDLNY